MNPVAGVMKLTIIVYNYRTMHSVSLPRMQKYLYYPLGPQEKTLNLEINNFCCRHFRMLYDKIGKTRNSSLKGEVKYAQLSTDEGRE